MGNKLIIFDQDRYAIFDAYEVFILCGCNVLMPTGVPEKITEDDHGLPLKAQKSLLCCVTKLACSLYEISGASRNS